MQIRKLKLKGTFEVKPRIMGDTRGYFAETYLSGVFEKHELKTDWVQDNQSLSFCAGTIRGLHFQAPPFAQTKLIRVLRGRVLDVFVDIRVNSPTFGQWDSHEISDEQCNAVYVPHGFAHGFCTLEENTLVQYKVDNPYSAIHEGGIVWNDPDLGIGWGLDEPTLSEKDSVLPFLRNMVSPFTYN